MLIESADIKQKSELFSKFSLLSELRAKGFEGAIQYKFDTDYEYLMSLKGYTSAQIYAERNRLREIINGLD